MRPLLLSIAEETYQGAGHVLGLGLLSNINNAVRSAVGSVDTLRIIKGSEHNQYLAFAGDNLFIQATSLTSTSCVLNTYQLHE